MNSSISAIKGQIEAECSLLRARANKLEAELAGIESELGKLTGALSALNGKEERDAVPRIASPKKKRNDKPAAGKEEVTRQLYAILSAEQVLDEAQLRERVEARLTEDGFSRMGLALRFKEALRDSRFVDTPGGIRLQESEEAAMQA